MYLLLFLCGVQAISFNVVSGVSSIGSTYLHVFSSRNSYLTHPDRFEDLALICLHY